jgi:hypothetical protein
LQAGLSHKPILAQVVSACADGVAEPSLVFDYYGSFHQIIIAIDKVSSFIQSRCKLEHTCLSLKQAMLSKHTYSFTIFTLMQQM